MDEIDRFQRPDHDLELNDLTRLIPLYDVHAVDDDSIHLGFEFEHGVRSADYLAHIAEGRIEEHLKCGPQVAGGERSAALRRMNHGRVEHGVFGKQAVERGWIMIAHQAVPGLQGMTGHRVTDARVPRIFVSPAGSGKKPASRQTLHRNGWRWARLLFRWSPSRLGRVRRRRTPFQAAIPYRVRH